jgi:hypothetical protein
MTVESLPDFTRLARQRWESIPADIRQRLQANVWCGQCRHEVTITDFSGTIKGGGAATGGQMRRMPRRRGSGDRGEVSTCPQQRAAVLIGPNSEWFGCKLRTTNKQPRAMPVWGFFLSG